MIQQSIEHQSQRTNMNLFYSSNQDQLQAEESKEHNASDICQPRGFHLNQLHMLMNVVYYDFKVCTSHFSNCYFKEFIKNKYNILIPVFLLVVLLIAILLYSKEYKSNRYAYVSEVEVYQYFSGIKMEYVANISRNKKSVILEYENKDSVVSLDSTPVYIKDKENVVFPKEMSIVFPLKDEQYQVNALSEIYKENGLYYLNIRNLNEAYDHMFFYDGGNLYFFVENVTLVVGNKNIELSPLSYVNASYGNFVEYYDYENDVYGMIDISDRDEVNVKNEFMTINVVLDEVVYKEGFTLLTNDFSFLTKINDMNK